MPKPLRSSPGPADLRPSHHLDPKRPAILARHHHPSMRRPHRHRVLLLRRCDLTRRRFLAQLGSQAARRARTERRSPFSGQEWQPKTLDVTCLGDMWGRTSEFCPLRRTLPPCDPSKPRVSRCHHASAHPRRLDCTKVARPSATRCSQIGP